MTFTGSIDTLAAEATGIVGADGVRAAVAGDTPGWPGERIVVEPGDEATLAQVLAWASRDGVGVVPRGGGTKLAWGPPSGAPVILSLARMNRLLAHRDGDLTVTVEAGARLADVNAALAVRWQRLPLDPPHGDRATIGGIVATNDSGPLRHSWGTPRDLLIGAAFVRADGTAAKAGGIVVKNVAGYDVARLLSASFGSLAVITSASFKLAPVTPLVRTVAIVAADLATADRVLLALRRGPWTPDAVEIAGPDWQVAVRFGSVEAAVRDQCEAVVAMARAEGCTAEVVDGADQDALVAGHEQAVWAGEGPVVRASCKPGEVVALVDAIARLCVERSVSWHLAGRALDGSVTVRLDASVEALSAIVTALRARTPVGEGSAIVIRMPAAWHRDLDAWGAVAAAPVMHAIKQRLDPLGILSPGRGPGGL